MRCSTPAVRSHSTRAPSAPILPGGLISPTVVRLRPISSSPRNGINSPIRDGLDLLRWRRAVGQFGYRAMIRRDAGDWSNEIPEAHCENWNGSRRLLYAPCTQDYAYVQLTSLEGDAAGNARPIGP